MEFVTARNNTEEDQEAAEEASVHVKEIWENDKNCSDHSRGKIG